MGQILVRNLDDDLKSRLRDRARRHGRSTEEEVREILRSAVAAGDTPPVRLGTLLARRFAGIGLTEPIAELRGEKPRLVRFER